MSKSVHEALDKVTASATASGSFLSSFSFLISHPYNSISLSLNFTLIFFQIFISIGTFLIMEWGRNEFDLLGEGVGVDNLKNSLPDDVRFFLSFSLASSSLSFSLSLNITHKKRKLFSRFHIVSSSLSLPSLINRKPASVLSLSLWISARHWEE